MTHLLNTLWFTDTDVVHSRANAIRRTAKLCIACVGYYEGLWVLYFTSQCCWTCTGFSAWSLFQSQRSGWWWSLEQSWHRRSPQSAGEPGACAHRWSLSPVDTAALSSLYTHTLYTEILNDCTHREKHLHITITLKTSHSRNKNPRWYFKRKSRLGV